MFEFDFKDNSLSEIDRFVEVVLDNINAISGTRRKLMYRKGHGLPEPKGSFSISFGYCNVGYMSKDKYRKEVQGCKNLFETTFMTHHPELKTIFQQLVNLHCPEPFTVDQVQINHNWQSPPHRDAGNVGESWIIGLGDYEGGETVVEFPKEHIEYNIKNTFIKFNGSKYIHWTKPYEGNRYSLVFYNHSKAMKTTSSNPFMK